MLTVPSVGCHTRHRYSSEIASTREHSMRTLNNRAGFALPMTILVIGFMTAGVLAAFARSGSEARLVDNERAQLTAFAVAEAGLQQYLAVTRGVPPATVTYVFANDTAIVTSKLIRPAV